MSLTFGELRNYISRIDRLSICMKEDLCYENYKFLKDVPALYDELYVYGIGRIVSEFEIDEHAKPTEIEGNEIGNGLFLAQCIEIVLSKEPKNIDAER